MTGYIYNAEGERVAKGSINQWSCDPTTNGFTSTTEYVLGPGGGQMSEMAPDANNRMTWQRSYVYAAGQLIATYDPGGVQNPSNERGDI